MKYFITLSLALSTCFISGCNTIGGLGQDVSEAGKALDNAAYWSQGQIQAIDQEISNPSN